ncbi:hypothetical protein FRC17_000556 [Serendipita sp. 399]|nr:hypothetical protein FRC17_000556 [Serendipita sp. 399]
MVHLPPELMIKIIGYLYYSPDDVLDRVWPRARQEPYRPLGDTATMEKMNEIGVVPRRVQLLSRGTHFNVPGDMILSTGSCPALNPLRLVSRNFYDVCQAFAYRELEIDHSPQKRHTKSWETGINTIEIDAGSVKTIKIHLGPKSSSQQSKDPLWTSFIMDIAKVMVLCEHTETISLYYSKGGDDITAIRDQTLAMIEQGSVRNIGVYSSDVLENARRSLDYSSTTSPQGLLRQILTSSRACERLRRLDIVMEHVNVDLVQLLQTQLTSIQSLTIRKALRLSHLKDFQPFHMTMWAMNSNLTKLVLAHCHLAFADMMIPLLAHFYHLEELVWAHCGLWWMQPRAKYFPKGWSKSAHSLPNIRAPLKLLHIENVSELELRIMGEIPAEELTISDRQEGRIGKAFTESDEIFPRTKILRVPSNPPGYVAHFASPLEVACRRREIKLFRNARVLFPYADSNQ